MATGHSNIPATSGIYRIRCLVNEKVYIGSAVSMLKRWREHCRALRRGNHDSPKLQRAWNKYGEAMFCCEIVELVESARLIEREQHHIDICRCAEREIGYNVSPTASSSLGIKRTPETRAKITAALTGKKASEETKSRMAAARRGQKRSEELGAKVRERQLGRKLPPEWRANISTGRIGLKISPEASARLSISRKGRKLNLSQEAIAKKKALRHSPESKAKMSAAVKARWIRQKSERSTSAATTQRIALSPNQTCLSRFVQLYFDFE